MLLSRTPGASKRFRRTPWRFQRTFGTPLKNLQPFVATIVEAAGPADAGCVTIDGVIFDPRNLLALLAKHSLPPQYGRDWSITVDTRHDAQSLLEAALSDWVDFIFVPTPKPFVVYADHDEYTTFYANTKSNLNRVTEALSKQGFERIEDYERTL
jgi:hypothetical protein